uniref:Uncharacterized protein n=1 Tax=Avena sativa TaxID=4498 RepID=A0ACD5TD83_AVESA
MESDGEEEEAATPGPTTPAPAGGRLKGCPELSVDCDMREMAKTAAWSVSSCKPGNGVSSLRDNSLDTYWQSAPLSPPLPPRNFSPFPPDQRLSSCWIWVFLVRSDGAQPHLVNIQFQKKVQLQLVVLYVDFKLDESYTPSKISIRAGDGFHNLKEIKTVDLLKPVGWVHVSLSGTDPRETFIHTFMLQIAVLANHLNGRDTHVRQIKIYGPRPNHVPHQPFHFTSRECIMYSTVR